MLKRPTDCCVCTNGRRPPRPPSQSRQPPATHTDTHATHYRTSARRADRLNAAAIQSALSMSAPTTSARRAQQAALHDAIRVRAAYHHHTHTSERGACACTQDTLTNARTHKHTQQSPTSSATWGGGWRAVDERATRAQPIGCMRAFPSPCAWHTNCRMGLHRSLHPPPWQRRTPNASPPKATRHTTSSITIARRAAGPLLRHNPPSTPLAVTGPQPYQRRSGTVSHCVASVWLANLERYRFSTASRFPCSCLALS